ncbi:hypothetical protein [Pseudoalteromonas sp.]|jgi:hypothetical protein|uniref:hypothetical protein n=1 Tax=Pseudoalteromonas sp. TaxID=53249 RepID=UPI003567D642
MLIKFFIKSPHEKLNNLTQQMQLRSELKRQHQAAFKYRLKRFAVTKVGLTSAFLAGAVMQASDSNSKFIRKFAWLARLLT